MEKNWEGLSEEEREDQIFDSLTQIDLEHADPDFSSRLITAKAATTDAADNMRLDLEMVKRVIVLRKEGKMLHPEQLKTKAKAMTKLDSSAMRAALTDFSRELDLPKEA